MIEMRLCSLALAKWLNARRAGDDVAPPSLTELGPSIHAYFKKRDPSDLAGIHAVAPTGVPFSSSDFAISVVHALGLAAALQGMQSNQADTIERFITGTGEFADVPRSLADDGVFAVMPKNICLEMDSWIRSIDHQTYEEEVTSMFGADAVADYTAAATNLQGVFESVRIHGCDIAGWAPKS